MKASPTTRVPTSLLPTEEVAEGEDPSEADVDVVFDAGPLGLQFEAASSGEFSMSIDAFVAGGGGSESQAQRFNRLAAEHGDAPLKEGMVLVAVGETPASGMGAAELSQLIREMPRPLTLTFRDVESLRAKNDVKHLKLELARMQMHADVDLGELKTELAKTQAELHQTKDRLRKVARKAVTLTKELKQSKKQCKVLQEKVDTFADGDDDDEHARVGGSMHDVPHWAAASRAAAGGGAASSEQVKELERAAADAAARAEQAGEEAAAARKELEDARAHIADLEDMIKAGAVPSDKAEAGEFNVQELIDRYNTERRRHTIAKDQLAKTRTSTTAGHLTLAPQRHTH